MMIVPEPSLAFGFANNPVGTHGSRTIMLAELRRLLAACPASGGLEDYRSAVVGDNVLLKKTTAGRHASFRALRELYALNRGTLLFRALRDLWDDDVQSQPLLALLCAVARDPILRATAKSVLEAGPGTVITRRMLARLVGDAFPGRYGAGHLYHIGGNVASSWQQSGQLRGRNTKVRARAESRPAAVAYALLLGYLCGGRGEGLFDTLWSHLLDAQVHVLHEHACAAGQRGWIDYRRGGGVTEVAFKHLLRAEGSQQ